MTSSPPSCDKVLYVEAGAGHRKKKKTKMKSYTRKVNPVNQATTGNDELLKSVSRGKGMCDVSVVCFAVSFLNATPQTM